MRVPLTTGVPLSTSGEDETSLSAAASTFAGGTPPDLPEPLCFFDPGLRLSFGAGRDERF